MQEQAVRHMDELPAFLTVPEAARVLRLKRSTAYELVRQGAIPSIRLGRQIRVPRDRLLAWLREAN